MTGEYLPVDKTVGDEVSSGTVNQFGAFEMCATKVGEDSSIQRMQEKQRLWGSLTDVVLSDTIRSESVGTIKVLEALNVQPVLLTGDNEKAAASIARQLGISEIQANCLPEDKLKYINEYQNRQEAVCMIGDGINDAPALKATDVGIAMGGVGSDIAVDAADIALVDDEVKELPHLLALSKRMMTTIKINMSFSMGLNFIAIILAITGTLDPVIGALVHNAGSVLVITNSALLLKWRKCQL